MLFHTTQFFAFFLIVFAVYWRLRAHRLRMAWLLVSSVVFYASWNPWLVGLILLSTSVDYVAALLIEAAPSCTRRRLILMTSITVNLTILAIFKYANFFLESVFWTWGIFGHPIDAPAWRIVLPLGISFYTFEAISYVVDVYRGRVRAVRSWLDYGLYIMFFPHLIAGPIVRSHDFLPQLARRKRWQWERASAGVQIFLLGLFKKAILADHLAAVVDPVFSSPSSFDSTSIWLAVLAYSAQIYCDFSGYSDMAVGLAHLLGFKLPQNFRLPYLAASLGELWRRWHISLSSWLRDYLYIPMGGNRGGMFSVCRALLVTMLLGGLWHGASWTFVAWGLFHGLLLVAERLRWAPWLFLPKPFAIASTFLLVVVGWVFFRAQSFSDAGVILHRIAWPTSAAILAPDLVAVGLACLAAVALGTAFAALVSWPRFARKLPAPALGVALACIFLLVQLLYPSTSAAFIYFQF